MSALEESLLRQLGATGLPEAQREVRFHPVRRWRFDFSWPDHMVAVEVEGATWANGRHNRGAGLEADCDKYNTAAVMGWRVLRVTGAMVKDGRAVDFIQRALTTESEVQQHAAIA